MALQAKKEEERAGQQRAPAAAVEPEEHGNYGKVCIGS